MTIHKKNKVGREIEMAIGFLREVLVFVGGRYVYYEVITPTLVTRLSLSVLSFVIWHDSKSNASTLLVGIIYLIAV